MLTTEADGPHSIFAADVDGDGDPDLLSASYNDDEIAWYENTDGAGSFGPQQVIYQQDFAGAQSVFATDVDGDGDNDVLSAFWDEFTIAWHENTDGTGSFGARQVIASGIWFPSSVVAADLDGDGDADVLCSAYDKLVWYENTDGSGSFGPEQGTWTAVDGIFVADVNGDGDADVISTSYDGDKLAWYENTNGAGSFGPEQGIATGFDGTKQVVAADVDGDGDQDVLATAYWGDEVAWYENTNGAGSFGPRQVIDVLSIRLDFLFATDLDADGDTDFLSATTIQDKIVGFRQVNAADPLDADSDDDGLCDGGPPGAAPECALGGEDANGNGVYDVGSETDPGNPDTDGDGFLDGLEVAEGSDPLDAQDYPGVSVPSLSPVGAVLLAAMLASLPMWWNRRPPRPSVAARTDPTGTA